MVCGNHTACLKGVLLAVVLVLLLLLVSMQAYCLVAWGLLLAAVCLLCSELYPGGLHCTARLSICAEPIRSCLAGAEYCATIIAHSCLKLLMAAWPERASISPGLNAQEPGAAQLMHKHRAMYSPVWHVTPGMHSLHAACCPALGASGWRLQALTFAEK